MGNGISVTEYDCACCGTAVTRPPTKGQRPKWCPDCRGRSARHRFTCASCGKTVTGSGTKFCSRSCAADARRKPKLSKPPKPPKPRREPKPKVWAVFFPECAVCHRVFATRYTVATCSPACAATKKSNDRRDAKHRSRARKRGAFIAPVYRAEVYRRDGWRCQICGRKVRRVPVPYPLSPTIDHIVPLALGGTHEPANVRLAHFICNSRRGASEDGPQLALFG